jgi:hypothetical protein
MSKAGVQSVRKTLYMAAIAVQFKNKPAKVIVCAVIKKLMHVFFGMLKNGQRFDSTAAFAQ